MLLIIIGYVAAVLAVGAFLVGTGEVSRDSLTQWLFVVVLMLPSVSIFLAYYTAWPACAAIILTEFLGSRDWWPHVVAAGLVGAAVALSGEVRSFDFLFKYTLFAPSPEELAAPLKPAFALRAALASVVAGSVYWLIAGRRAGAWRGALPGGRGRLASSRADTSSEDFSEREVFVFMLRVLLVLIGYAVAILAASVFMVAIQRQGLQGPTGDLPLMLVMTFLGSVVPMWLFLAATVLVPACIAIFLCEQHRRQDWQTHAIGGAAAGAAIGLFWYLYGEGQIELSPYAGSIFSEPSVLWELIGAGIVGGLFYWLMAGSSSGEWRETTSPEPTGS